MIQLILLFIKLVSKNNRANVRERPNSALNPVAQANCRWTRQMRLSELDLWMLRASCPTSRWFKSQTKLNSMFIVAINNHSIYENGKPSWNRSFDAMWCWWKLSLMETRKQIENKCVGMPVVVYFGGGMIASELIIDYTLRCGGGAWCT